MKNRKKMRSHSVPVSGAYRPWKFTVVGNAIDGARERLRLLQTDWACAESQDEEEEVQKEIAEQTLYVKELADCLS